MRLAFAFLLCLALLPGRALASGLFLSDRGTRALGRGGAFVAGASGLDAVGYNPAGLSGTGMLGELTLPLIRADYQRRLAIDDGTGTTTYVDEREIHGKSELIPFPTAIGAYTTESGFLTLAGGLITPTFSLMSFPTTVDGEPSPARYTLSGFSDSRILMVGGWLALHFNDVISVGGGMHGLIGTFRSTVGFSLSPPDRVLAAPEDPDYDAYGRISVGPMITPSGSLGIKLTPTKELALGLSGELPIWIDSDATFDVRLPNSAAFEDVKVQGNKAHLDMRLPAVLRTGIQYTFKQRLALELAYVREFWSLHNAIHVEPKGIQISGVPGGPESFSLPNITIPRHYQDSNSFRLGAEFTDELFGKPIQVRAGVAYDQSAVPDAYLSLSSLDFDKWLMSVGGSMRLSEHVRGDFSYAFVRTKSTTVSPEAARLPRINPLAGNAPEEHVNGGTYTIRAHVLSGALAFLFD